MIYKIKNQNFVKGLKNDCTIYTATTILELTYIIKLSYGLIEKLASIAFIDKILTLLGAKFSTIYNYVAKKISKQSGLNIIVEKLYIPNAGFEYSVNQGNYFGIGLKYANIEYLKCIAKGKITKKDIDAILKNGEEVYHNNAFGISLNGKGTSIMEIARGEEVKCSLEVLKYGVEKGVFWSPARTFVGGDERSRFILKILKGFSINPNKDYKFKEPIKNEWRDEAANLYLKYNANAK